MKPLHIGLLVVGAALAGGLAVRMTQAPAIPAPAPVEVAADVAKPAPPAPAQSSAPIAAPAPISVEATKPSPMPDAAAPAPVYNEEPKETSAQAESVVRDRKAMPSRKPKPAAPVTIAKVKPKEWQPRPYEPPAEPAAPAPAPAQSAAPAPAAPSDPAPPVEQATAPEPPPAPESPAPRRVVLPTGMTIPVRLNESLSTDRAMPGDAFWGSLAEPLVADGLVIAERGARVSGRVTASQRAGRLSGTSVLTLALSTIVTSDGQRVSVSTEPWTRQGDSSLNQDLVKIGGGAALGAIIGAIAGGGKGAAIGGGIGGAAGVGAAAATRGKPATIPSETVIDFRLASRITVTEQIAAR